MQRDQALLLLQQHLKNDNLFKHSLAVEAIMRELALYLEQDEELFALAGLLHDIDYDTTAEDPVNHSRVGAAILQEHGLPPEVVYAVQAHNGYHGLPRNTLLDKALYAADPASGFITAAVLLRPDKDIMALHYNSIRKRFKEKAFARGANRDQMASCNEMGMSLDEFLSLALLAMQKHASEIGFTR